MAIKPHVIYYDELGQRLYVVSVKQVTMRDAAAIMRERLELHKEVYPEKEDELPKLDVKALLTNTDPAADAEYWQYQNYPLLHNATQGLWIGHDIEAVEEGYNEDNLPWDALEAVEVTRQVFSELPEALVVHWLFGILTYNPQYGSEFEALKVFLLRGVASRSRSDFENCWLSEKIDRFLSDSVSSG